jgi:hypothetical protein
MVQLSPSPLTHASDSALDGRARSVFPKLGFEHHSHSLRYVQKGRVKLRPHTSVQERTNTLDRLNTKYGLVAALRSTGCPDMSSIYQELFHIPMALQTRPTVATSITCELSSANNPACQIDTAKLDALAVRSSDSDSATRWTVKAASRLQATNHWLPIIPACEGCSVWRADEVGQTGRHLLSVLSLHVQHSPCSHYGHPSRCTIRCCRHNSPLFHRSSRNEGRRMYD